MTAAVLFEPLLNNSAVLCLFALIKKWNKYFQCDVMV